MRLAAAGQMAARCEFGGDLAIRQMIGMQLLGECDGVGSRLGVALAAFALAGRPLAIARPTVVKANKRVDRKATSRCDSAMNNKADRYLLTPAQHRQQAADLRKVNPQSRAAELHELAARLKENAAAGRVGCQWPAAPSITPARDDLGCQ
jgi:hypothetical protein